jgi:hypothetical protein
LGLLCAWGAVATADPIVPTYIYGIGDQNNIWQIDPVPGQQSFQQSYSTGLSGQSNAVAFDTGRDQLWFLSATNDLYLWKKSLGGAPGAFQQVTTASSLGIDSSLVYNASYYQDAFWFFKEATNTLVKASLDYSGLTPTLSGTTAYAIGGPTPSSDNGFGDIAINNNTGILYAATSTGLFYTVDLASPETTYNQILPAGSNISLQIAFNQDYSILYGHSYSSGAWYTVNTTSGSATALGYTTIVPGTSAGFRDLGGASVVSTVPEPSSLALAGVGIAGTLWRLTRRRRSS